MIILSSMFSPIGCCEKGQQYTHTDHSQVLEVVNFKPSGSARPCSYPIPEQKTLFFSSHSPCMLLDLGEHSSGSSPEILFLHVPAQCSLSEGLPDSKLPLLQGPAILDEGPPE